MQMLCAINKSAVFISDAMKQELKVSHKPAQIVELDDVVVDEEVKAGDVRD
jgi:hypothetical protein